MKSLADGWGTRYHAASMDACLHHVLEKRVELSVEGSLHG